MRWTHPGVRAMFSAAKRMDVIDSNPFTGLRLRGSRGRKDLDVLSVDEVNKLAACARKAWKEERVAQMVEALILFAGFVGMRPGELYGLRWDDIDLAEDEIFVQRQYVAKTRSFELPKNGEKRLIVLTPQAREALLRLPRPLDGQELVFRAKRGGPMSGRVQHYYWNPVRVAFGDPSMHFYELRHACGAWMFNDLGLPAQDVGHQLGHTDGGVLVQKLYGHPSERLARKRIKQAMRATPAEVVQITEPGRSHAV